jgi:hypothetical protein
LYKVCIFDVERDIILQQNTKRRLFMNSYTWKVLLVFSALLMFAFTGELAAQDNLVITPDGATLDLEDTQVFQARLTASGAGVNGLTVEFEVLNPPALGSVSPSDSTTVNGGYAHTTYTAGTTSGTDTLVASWEGLADTVIITINPGTATSLNVSPGDTTVVVTEDAVIVVELWDDYLNHVDATSGSQVAFTTSGLGTFGTASVNAETGCIEVAYTTDDSMATDIITTELLSNGTEDYDTVNTIGAAPATIILTANDSTVVVGGNSVELACSLFDSYGNPSAFSNYYPVGDPTMYEVAFSVSEGGGDFLSDSMPVDEYGVTANLYFSSDVADTYNIMTTSGDAEATVDITQITDYPDSVIVTPDSIAIPAGADTTLTAVSYDRFGNHCDAADERFVDYFRWQLLEGRGYLDTANAYIEDNDWKCSYLSFPAEADTALIVGYYNAPDAPYDMATIFSAEPGDLDHFAISLLSFEDLRIPLEIPEGEDMSFDDHALVSDGIEDTAYLNAVMVEARDSNNIRLWTYENADTIVLTLDGSSADSSQVKWFVMNMPDFEADLMPAAEPGIDTIVGLSAFIPDSAFFLGFAFVAATNQVAETVTITATDTAGHTGTSPELTWLPTEVVGFEVGLEGGATTMETGVETDVEVTAIDEFGNATDVGLPLNIVLSANMTGVITFPTGTTQLMQTAVDLFPTVGEEEATGLILTAADISEPSINGSSYEIEVTAGGIEEAPVVSNVSAKFGSGDVLCAVAEAGEVTVKVYNKVGMEVGTLLSGNVGPGYYQLSLKDLNLASDVYFVVMKGANVDKRIKTAFIK